MLYDLPLKIIPKTSPRTTARLSEAGIHSVGDLLDMAPYRYEDYRTTISIAELAYYAEKNDDDLIDTGLLSKNRVTIQGRIEKTTQIFARRGFSMQKVSVSDDTGRTTITWFNQPFLLRLMKEGETLNISGPIKIVNGVSVIQPDNFEIVAEVDGFTPIHTARIVPIYSAVPGVSSRTLREKVFVAVSMFASTASEVLPVEILKNLKVAEMADVYSQMHFPNSPEEVKSARDRMSFNELFCIQLKSRLIRREWERQNIGFEMNITYMEHIRTFTKKLPFALTNAQERAISEIIADMSQTQPMNRLLQGDVGSGKTIVTFTAALFAYFNGKKSLYMAPTEILAQQHYKTLSVLASLGEPANRPSVCLITSSSKPTNEEVAKADIIVGTHALISSKHEFGHVGLVIVDEQHKFGVTQRAALRKKGLNAHMLSLTATPIPRTVLLALYGELSVSIIDELPKGRKVIKTFVTPESKRNKGYEWIKQELKMDHQIFVVCPFIDQSEKDTLQSVKAATEEIKKLSRIFKEYRVELLHGRLKSAEKDELMNDFARGSIDILVATPVVEVGIDVPQATVIIIEGAERFGLAQLHQLRGRVGRSDIQSYCILFTSSDSDAVQRRLQFFAKTNDGYELAKYDLSHRGGGNMFGTQQHGYSSIALETLLDPTAVEKAQKACERFINGAYAYEAYPFLAARFRAFDFEAIVHN